MRNTYESSTLFMSGVLFTQPCLTLCKSMHCSLPGSSVHGILQTRILEWVAISFSRDLPDPGIEHGSPALEAYALPSEPPSHLIHQQSCHLYLQEHRESNHFNPSSLLTFYPSYPHFSPFCYDSLLSGLLLNLAFQKTLKLILSKCKSGQASTLLLA